MYPDIGRMCGGVAHSKENHKYSTTDRKHGPWSNWAVNIRQSWRPSESHLTAVQKECSTPPHVHPTSKYFTACDQFYQAFLQTKNIGVRRSGYEVTFVPDNRDACWTKYNNPGVLTLDTHTHATLTHLKKGLCRSSLNTKGEDIWYGRLATHTSKNGSSVFSTSPTITCSFLAEGLHKIKQNKKSFKLHLNFRISQ